MLLHFQNKKKCDFNDSCKSNEKTEILPSSRQTSSAKLTCLASQCLVLLPAAVSRKDLLFARVCFREQSGLILSVYLCALKRRTVSLVFFRQRCCVVVCSTTPL